MSTLAKVMIGVGGLILHPTEKNKFLLLKRSTHHSSFNPEKWELLYGRKDALENIETALLREAKEELGITDLKILYPLRLWHFMRGEASPENEIVGISFVCTTQQTEFHLSVEHTAYEWVTVETALKRVTVAGIRQDIEMLAQSQNSFGVSNLDYELTLYHRS